MGLVHDFRVTKSYSGTKQYHCCVTHLKPTVKRACRCKAVRIEEESHQLKEAIQCDDAPDHIF
jgi:hypothetical protein